MLTCAALATHSAEARYKRAEEGLGLSSTKDTTESTHLQPDVKEEEDNADLCKRLCGVDVLHEAQAVRANDNASNEVAEQRRLCIQ